LTIHRPVSALAWIRSFSAFFQLARTVPAADILQQAGAAVLARANQALARKQ
jgi:hypothetical protein